MEDAAVPADIGEPMVPLRWVVPEDLHARCATHLFVHQNGHEFTLYFFEAKPPLIAGSAEETRAQLARVGAVPVECFAKIMVSASRMPEFVGLLATQLQYHLEQASGRGEQ